MRRKRLPGRAGEQGYILVAVLFLAVMVLIVLATAAPKIAAEIQRDREIELVHRGQQYTRAIKLYYKKFGKYPPNMESLEKTNEVRFLRKRYKDPMTGKDEWHLIHFGENKTPSYGLFGQPIGGAGGSTLAGVGPMGGNGLGGPGASAGGLFNSNAGGNGTIGSTSPFSNSTGTTSTDPTSGGTTTTGTDPSTGKTAGTDPGTSGGGTTGTGTGQGPTPALLARAAARPGTTTD